MTMKKSVIFLCVNNSCRSQMAEGILRHLSGNSLNVFSAGTTPTTVNPYAIKSLQEIGIDISGQRSKLIYEFANKKFDYVITTCDEAKDACPIFHGDAKKIHLNLKDPAKASGAEEDILKEFRKTRDEIIKFVNDFISSANLC